MKLTRAYYDLEEVVEILSTTGHEITIKDLIYWGETRELELHIKTRGEKTADIYRDTIVNGFQRSQVKKVFLYDIFRINFSQVSDILKGRPLTHLPVIDTEDEFYFLKEPTLFTRDDIVITAKNIFHLKESLPNKKDDTNKDTSFPPPTKIIPKTEKTLLKLIAALVLKNYSKPKYTIGEGKYNCSAIEKDIMEHLASLNYNDDNLKPGTPPKRIKKALEEIKNNIIKDKK